MCLEIVFVIIWHYTNKTELKSCYWEQGVKWMQVPFISFDVLQGRAKYTQIGKMHNYCRYVQKHVWFALIDSFSGRLISGSQM